jgi:ribosome-associated protein
VTSDKLARLCAKLAAEKKAADIIAIDLREISGFTDFFVVCSGSSEPQLKAILGEIRDKLKEEHGLRPLAVDGFPMSQWVVLDYGDVVVHIFHESKRAFYAIEDLWGDAPRLKLRLPKE